MLRARWALGLLLALPSPRAAPAADTLELADLIAEALADSPQLRAARAAHEAAALRPRQERALPNPILSPSYIRGGGLPSGLALEPESSNHLGAMISQELPIAGKRQLHGEIAASETAVVLQEYEATRLAVIARVKQAYHRLQHAEAAIELIVRERDRLRRLRRSSDAPYFLGQSAQDAQVNHLDLRVLELGRERQRLVEELNLLRARSFDAPLPSPPPLGAPPPPPALAELSERALRSAPALRTAHQRVERERLDVELARKQFWPDPTLSFGYHRLHASPDIFELRADFAIPLQRRDREQAHLSERSAALEEARFRAAALELELLWEVRALHRQAQVAVEQKATYADRIIPESRKALNAYLAGYEGGVVDFMAVQESFMSTLEYQLSYLDQALSACLALDRLEELTGLELQAQDGS